jgi:hypothetical protein
MKSALTANRATESYKAALDADGNPREDAQVAEITGLLGDLSTWPAGHRVFVRREPLHPRYAKDASAYETKHEVRLQAFATNTPGRQPAWLDCRHRTHARVESKIRDGKDGGLNRFPSRLMKINQAWLTVTALACDLGNWIQLLALSGTNLAKAIPKTLRYRFLHVPAVLVRGQRKRRLKFPSTWPWAHEIVTAPPPTGPAPPHLTSANRRAEHREETNPQPSGPVEPGATDATVDARARSHHAPSGNERGHHERKINSLSS